MYLPQQLGKKKKKTKNNNNNNNKKNFLKKISRIDEDENTALKNTFSKFTKSELVILSDPLNIDHACQFSPQN